MGEERRHPGLETRHLGVTSINSRDSTFKKLEISILADDHMFDNFHLGSGGNGGQI
jgi:hypothetical protein